MCCRSPRRPTCACVLPAPLLAEWLEGGALQKVVLVVTGASSKEVLERWTFDIQTDKGVVAGRWVHREVWLDKSLGRELAPRGKAAEGAEQPACTRLHHRLSLSPPVPFRPRSAPLPEKSEAQITQEIQAIIRQITASVTFLPLLQDTCATGCGAHVHGCLPCACHRPLLLAPAPIPYLQSPTTACLRAPPPPTPPTLPPPPPSCVSQAR